jgi:hypothetical protein
MGYTAIPFAVSIDSVRKVFGSRDENLLAELEQTELFEHYADDLPIDEAMREFIY